MQQSSGQTISKDAAISLGRRARLPLCCHFAGRPLHLGRRDRRSPVGSYSTGFTKVARFADLDTLRVAGKGRLSILHVATYEVSALGRNMPAAVLHQHLGLLTGLRVPLSPACGRAVLGITGISWSAAIKKDLA